MKDRQMADTSAHHSDFQASRSSLLKRFGAAVVNGYSVWTDAHIQRDQVEALQAKSDDALAAMGLRREDIVRHVLLDRAVI